jgi:hypothetical protein
MKYELMELIISNLNRLMWNIKMSQIILLLTIKQLIINLLNLILQHPM